MVSTMLERVRSSHGLLFVWVLGCLAASGVNVPDFLFLAPMAVLPFATTRMKSGLIGRFLGQRRCRIMGQPNLVFADRMFPEEGPTSAEQKLIFGRVGL